MSYSYQISPRPPGVGGGWQLRLFEHDKEVGGGVFPLAAFSENEDPKQAAYDDAQEEGETWLSSRPQT